MDHKITAVKTAPVTAPALARVNLCLSGLSSGRSSTPRSMVSQT
jgi:hypothetical protein